jgi:hypothetical protein
MGGILGMANAFSVNKHPKKKAIIRALINQEPYNKIANDYGLTESAVKRYAYRQLRKDAANALVNGGYGGAALLERIEETIVYVQKIYDACNEWLEDVDDPSKYNIDPRAHEHQVIYNLILDDSDGKETRIRKKANLQELLNRAMRDDEEIIKVESKISDPRKLILDTAQTLNKQLDSLAKIAGLVQEVTNVDINITQNNSIVTNVVKVIERETADQPELMQRLVEGVTNGN